MQIFNLGKKRHVFLYLGIKTQGQKTDKTGHFRFISNRRSDLIVPNPSSTESQRQKDRQENRQGRTLPPYGSPWTPDVQRLKARNRFLERVKYCRRRERQPLCSRLPGAFCSVASSEFLMKVLRSMRKCVVKSVSLRISGNMRRRHRKDHALPMGGGLTWLFPLRFREIAQSYSTPKIKVFEISADKFNCLQIVWWYSLLKISRMMSNKIVPHFWLFRYFV